MKQPQISPEERARVMDFLLKEDQTYSIAFMCGNQAVQKAEVIQQSKLYRHFQVFQPGELDLAGFEAVHRHSDEMEEFR